MNIQVIAGIDHMAYKAESIYYLTLKVQVC